MKVVTGLDKTLFDRYVKPKAAVVAAILREGILDKDMDWYETPHPTGEPVPLLFSGSNIHSRGTAIYVHGLDGPRRDPRADNPRC